MAQQSWWTSLKASGGALVEREALRPDLGRAVRATVGFVVPLLLALHGWLPVEVAFAAIAAQNINFVDVRGAYSLRLGVLLLMSLVLVGATWLGVVSGDAGSVWAAALGTVAIALAAGF